MARTEKKSPMKPISGASGFRFLLLFFIVAILIAAPLFFALAPETPVALRLTLLVLGSCAPAAAALIVLRIDDDARETAAFRLRIRTWRVAGRWYLAAVLIPTAVWLAGAGVVSFLRQTVAFQPAGLLLFPIVCIAALGEEIGWRGFALPRLLPRFNAVTSSVFVGVMWGAFLAPLYWQRPVFVVLNFGLTISLSVVLTWLFLRTRSSVLLCTLLHAVFYTWGQAFLMADGGEGPFGVAVFFMWVAADILVIHNGANLWRETSISRDDRGKFWWL